MGFNSVQLISWNVNGISNKTKKYSIISHLKSLSCDLAMIQETHTNVLESAKLRQGWVGQVYSAPGNGASRGVATLISKKISFKLVKQIADKDGRYLILFGLLQSEKCVLVNIYAPNTGQSTFLSKLNLMLAEFAEYPILMGGDFNAVSNAVVDRSGHPLPSDRALSSAFKEILNSFALSDVWRTVNPDMREYTFYSSAHLSYSRIDYMLFSQCLVGNVIDCKIHPIIISDHAPLSTLFVPKVINNKNKQWRFNNSLLKEQDFISLIEERTQEFISINLASVESVQIVWEAYKATCRGWIIGYASAKKKEKMAKKQSLINELKNLESKHMMDPTNIQIKKAVEVSKTELKSIIYEENAFALYQLRRREYESGDKAGKMLALRLKQQESRQTISSIYDVNGALVCDQLGINQAFANFYSTLYKSECCAGEEEMEHFFKDIQLPCLSTHEKDSLDTPILENEIKFAIKSLSTGKCCGDDGYSSEFFKCFHGTLTPLLKLLFNDIVSNQSMPLTMRQATISLIPKPGKDHLQMGNFRPLSILNNDYKIFAKVLAIRIEKVIPSLIHVDQTGFIKGRYASNNMRRLFQVMYEAETSRCPAIAVSLDAEKAFDRVEWKYLFYTLPKYGFGPMIMDWIRALYHKPVASVRTNGIKSNPFQLYRSTRQGCNVSPLIFILALEPLACAIRAQEEIHGITVCDYEYKANLFADDILLTLSNPTHSIPHVLQLIDSFGRLSGYRVNYTKSEAIPLNNLTFQSHLGSAPFSWKPKGMKYLGIKIQAPIDKMVELNAPELIKIIREDTKRWTVLPLSLWGRSETIKMNLLPRLTFMMSSIPLKFPPSWFKEINKIFSGFLWNNKKPRISQKKLINPRSCGGIGLPDIYQYYIAYNSRYPLQWAYNRDRQIGSWEWLEEQLVSKHNKELTLSNLWYNPSKIRLKNPLLKFSCEIVTILHKRLSFNGYSLPSCPLWHNPLFTAGGKTLKDMVWQQHNLKQVGQIVDNGKMITFNNLKTQFGLTDFHFLIYNQIYSIVRSLSSRGVELGTAGELENGLVTATKRKGTVSTMYKLLLSSNPCSNLHTKYQWEREIGLPISETQWNAALRNSTTVSKCVRYKIIQLKIIHRAYMTPKTMNKIDPSISKMCWHGCGSEGTLIHMLWTCPLVKQFWTDIIKDLNLLDGSTAEIEPCPIACVLGVEMSSVQSRMMRHVLLLAFVAAKRIILMNWKERKQNCFHIENWRRDFMDILAMEQGALALNIEKPTTPQGPWDFMKTLLTF